jgi:hypothetical protein
MHIEKDKRKLIKLLEEKIRCNDEERFEVKDNILRCDNNSINLIK